jgi:hypothetical protein
LTIYDVLGHEVAVLVNGVQQPGSYEVEFKATGLASGVYFARLTSGSQSAVRKLVLSK